MSSITTVPVLDISGFLADEHGPVGDAFVAEFRDTVHRTSFLVLDGHGVDPALRARVDDVTRRFFALPPDELESIANVHSPHFRGYTRLGGEHTKGVPDLRDQLDVGTDSPARTIGPGDPRWWGLIGPNLLPPSIPELPAVIGEWRAALGTVTAALLRVVARSIGQPEDALARHFDPATNSFVKVVRYHPARPEFPGSWGVGEHTDGTLFAIVHQDEVGGLQELIEGEWVDVPVRTGALGINVGTALQFLTDGFYRHVWHRVTPPPAGVFRYSVCYFPSVSRPTLAPLPLPAHLLAEIAPEDRTDPASPLVGERRYHEGLLRAIRSHPDVARVHYPDLLAEAGLA